MLEDDWVGYHAGIYDINLKSIGIELEDEAKRDEWIYPKKEIETLKSLVAKLCKEYKIPRDKGHILLHKNLVSDRIDPVGNFDLAWII